MNIIMLDCDGVLNSIKLCKQWINKRFDEEQKNHKNLTVGQIRKAVEKAYKKQFVDSKQLIFPQLASKVMQICEKCDAYIVWSSSWRILKQYQNIENTKQMFNRRGLPGNRLIGYTPLLRFRDAGYRSTCINRWINENKDKYNISKVAVIDDRTDAGFNLNDKCMFFLTNQQIGITDQIKNKIITYFND